MSHQPLPASLSAPPFVTSHLALPAQLWRALSTGMLALFDSLLTIFPP